MRHVLKIKSVSVNDCLKDECILKLYAQQEKKTMKKAGYQGDHGTFSEIAARTWFHTEEIENIGYPNFVSIMEDIESRKLDYAVLPVENTTTGIIARTYDLFQNYHMWAIGEINVPINHNLIAFSDTKVEEIRKVYSHPEALSQCTDFFAKYPDIQQVPYQDTAKSVEFVKESNDHTLAALGSWRAAEYYDMKILAENVQNTSNNMTRFLVIQRDEEPASKEADKVSLMCVLKHTPGSLYNALGILAKRGINIVKLESRPIAGHLFDYMFYIDISGNLKNKDVKAAMKELELKCVRFRIFGNYKSAGI